jgi:hypothetical protein
MSLTRKDLILIRKELLKVSRKDSIGLEWVELWQILTTITVLNACGKIGGLNGKRNMVQ